MATSHQLTWAIISLKNKGSPQGENRDNKENNNEESKKPADDDSQDTDPLKGHKYELKFEYNPESKRSRRVIIWRYDNWNKEFVKTWNIVDHFRIHTKENPFKCKIWEKDFTQKGNLKKHLKKHKSEAIESMQKYKWEKCESKYSSEYNLRLHMRKDGH